MEEERMAVSDKLFKEMDVIILPTTTTVTPTIAEAKANGPFALDPFNTDQFNYYGLPAISIPCGFSKNGLPLGLQIVGQKGGDTVVLAAAEKYQTATTWHSRHPPL
jgi:aspartyl-tRNA(Asn)/glutamyl-tRNA(Gln) amidotransferase subunit A